jgi:hypothetical protein
VEKGAYEVSKVEGEIVNGWVMVIVILSIITLKPLIEEERIM